MKSTISIIVFLLVAIGGAYLGYQYGVSSVAIDSDDAQASTEAVPTSTIRGQGKLQPAGGTINIMAQPGERIEEILVSVGQQVEQDDALVVLASQKVRKLELALAENRKAEAVQQAELQKSAGQFKLKAAEIASSEAQSAKSKVINQSQAIGPMRSNLEAATRVLEKLKSMRGDPVTKDLVGQNEIDKQQALVEGIESQIQQAESEVTFGDRSADRAFELAENQRELAKYNLDNSDRLVPTESLDLAIELAQLALDATSIKSPIAGTVIDIAAFRGDTVTNRPLMLIGDTRKMVCVAEVTDSQLRDVHVGARVELTSAALEKSLQGKVVEVGTMIGPPSMVDPNPYAVVDRKTGKVKIELAAEDVARAAKFVNLQVEVRIAAKEDTSSDGTTTSNTPETTE